MTRKHFYAGFVAATVVALVLAAASTVQGKSSSWRDDFSGTSLDSSRWVNASGQAPGYVTGSHRGLYDPTHVRVSGGYLVIELTQENSIVDGASGVESRGGLIYTKSTYGYGTYEWRLRMSSTATTPGSAGLPVSGTVSAGFNYVNNSQTEIDFEFAGHDPANLFMSNWNNTNPRRDPNETTHLTSSLSSEPDLTSTFKTYRFVWERAKVSFYVDDVLQATHVTTVPRTAAHFMINHWGTNRPWWGGLATVGVPRYFYVDWVRYTPAP